MKPLLKTGSNVIFELRFNPVRHRKQPSEANVVQVRQVNPESFMKTKLNCFIIALALLALSTISSQFSTAFAQGTTAFTYQGRLNTGTNAANGSYDMTFAVWDANIAGNQIAGPITNSAVAVSNGLFTVTLDFGAGVFTGTNYWVQMAVSLAGTGTFAPLVPRQQLTPTPYAIALTAQSPQANALCPPGSVMAYMGTTAPPGWLLCDGSAVSRTNYAALFAVIGTASGYGDNSTTFNLPDMRGVFLRGVNGTRSDGLADPDDNTTYRINIFPGGNTGNAVGSYQGDMFKSHEHNIAWGYGFFAPPSGPYQMPIINAGFNGFPTDLQGGNETRPRNVYVNYIIKY
jgi:Phage Tail Collar Domain